MIGRVYPVKCQWRVCRKRSEGFLISCVQKHSRVTRNVELALQLTSMTMNDDRHFMEGTLLARSLFHVSISSSSPQHAITAAAVGLSHFPCVCRSHGCLWDESQGPTTRTARRAGQGRRAEIGFVDLLLRVICRGCRHWLTFDVSRTSSIGTTAGDWFGLTKRGLHSSLDMSFGLCLTPIRPTFPWAPQEGVSIYRGHGSLQFCFGRQSWPFELQPNSGVSRKNCNFTRNCRCNFFQVDSTDCNEPWVCRRRITFVEQRCMRQRPPREQFRLCLSNFNFVEVAAVGV